MLTCFVIFVAIMVVINYHDKITLHDFIVYDYVSCDPSEFSCFVYCEEECAYDDPYAKIEKAGRNIAACNPIDDECEELFCSPAEPNCLVTYCTDEEVEVGEVCHHI